MICAIRDMVIVKIGYKEQEGSIIIPDQAKQYNGDFWGEVISVGPDYPYELKAGDKIIFRRHEGTPLIDADGNEFLALKEKWVEGKIDD